MPVDEVDDTSDGGSSTTSTSTTIDHSSPYYYRDFSFYLQENGNKEVERPKKAEGGGYETRRIQALLTRNVHFAENTKRTLPASLMVLHR